MNNDLQQYKVYKFRDFVTPDSYATIPILGKRSALDALNDTVSAGFHAQSMSFDNEYPAYGPLVVAINAICDVRKMTPITASELYALQSLPGFTSFAKNFVKTHHAQDLINLDNFVNPQGTFTEDDMALMTAAFAASSGYGNIGLGFVTLVKGQSVKAFHYPESSQPPTYTAWIIVDCRAKDPVFYGIGRKAIQHEGAVQDTFEDDDDDEEDNQVPTTTPRKTATRVLQQQVPLPAGLTAQDILHHHKDRLQYNNVLKVALDFSNKEIADKCKSELLPKDQRLCHASAVVKRINTAINWIEGQFEMDKNAFRTTFDQERRAKGLSARGKDEVSDEVLAANSSKINAAMAWVKAGGPRSTQNDAPSPYDANASTTSVADPVSTGPFSGAPVFGHRSHDIIPAGHISAPSFAAGAPVYHTAPDPGYSHYSQMGVGSGGNTGSGMMSINNVDVLTHNHHTYDNLMTGLANGETGTQEDFDWTPQDFGFDDSYMKFE